MQVICPSNNIPERAYAVRVMFNDLLGIGLTSDDILFNDSVEDYHILVGGKEIVVEDHFFQHFQTPLSYIAKANIPDHVDYFHALGLTIPIVYGTDKYEETEGGIRIGLDIFASLFFMLARWEESLLGREEEGDCKEIELFTVRNCIHQRPIVHEYEQLLRKVLDTCGVQMGERKYKVVLSHDVDGMLTPTYCEIISDFFDQKRNGPPQNTILNLTWKAKRGYKKTFPTTYSQFEFYTQQVKKYNILEWFYFKVCDKEEEEATYCYNDRRVRRVVSQLREEGNPNIIMGFHPSQTTFNNPQQWGEECHRIEKLLGEKPTIGRNHHLLYNLQTMRLWEKSFSKGGHPIDISNSVFHAMQGFRNGVAVPFPIFDYYERRQMNLIEHPNQIMDTVIRYNYNKYTDADRWLLEENIIDKVKEHKGELVLTWHIYLRSKWIITNGFDWCERILKYACK